ncbi:MAG: hypothetical protein AAGF94_05345, partial [Pseudomonadota bacterium]
IVTVAPHMGGLRTEPGSTPNLALTKPDEQTPSASKAAVQESVPPHITIETPPEPPVENAAETSEPPNEPLFSGALGGLLPDLSLLDPEMRHFSTETFDIERRLKFTGKDVTAGRMLLRDANYVGLEVKYDSDCNRGFALGQVRHAIFQIDQFDTQAQAEAYWDLPSERDPTRLMRDETPLRDLDHWVGEKLINCGSKPSNLHWRIIRVGNMFLHVGLFTSDRSINDPNIAALSEALILSMAEKIPGSGL